MSKPRRACQRQRKGCYEQVRVREQARLREQVMVRLCCSPSCSLTKLGMGKSSTFLSGFSFNQLMIAGIKLVAKSFLQASTATATACYSNSFFSSAAFFASSATFFSNASFTFSSMSA